MGYDNYNYRYPYMNNRNYGGYLPYSGSSYRSSRYGYWTSGNTTLFEVNNVFKISHFLFILFRLFKWKIFYQFYQFCRKDLIGNKEQQNATENVCNICNKYWKKSYYSFIFTFKYDPLMEQNVISHTIHISISIWM